MNILVIGDDPATQTYVRELLRDTRHRIVMTHPPMDSLPGETDLETALAAPGIDAALIGGPLELRGEWLRRCAAQGWVCLCLNPPGINTDPYYQVALSNHEFRAVILPDLSLRFHPGIQKIANLTANQKSGGSIRSIVLELDYAEKSENLAFEPFPLWVDAVRSLIGDIENITAMGFPAGLQPTERFTAQLRGSGEKRAEITIRTGFETNRAKVVVTTEQQVFTLEFDPESDQAGSLHCASLSNSGASSPLNEPEHEDLGQWNRHRLMIDVWTQVSQNRDLNVKPSLLDGMRSMEVAEGAVRSLRRGRAIDLYYEEVSEANNFKTIMTSVGCMMVVGVLMALPLILAGPALGLPFTLYLGYLIPIIMAGFALLQLLRLVIR